MLRRLSPGVLAGWAARHPKRTIGMWLMAVLVSVVLIGSLTGDSLTTDIGPTGKPESQKAWDLIDKHFNVPDESITEVLTVNSSDYTVDDPEFREYVEQLFASVNALGPDFIVQGYHYYLTGEESLITLDRHTTAMVFLVKNNGSIAQFWDVLRNLGQDQWHIPTDTLDPDKGKAGFRVHSFRAGEGPDIIVVRSETLTVEDNEYRQFVEGLFYDLTALGRNVIWTGMYYYPFGAETLVSTDRHATLIVLNVGDEDNTHLVMDVIRNARNNTAFDISITGEAAVNEDFNELSAHDLKTGELMIGLPIAVLVLIVVFGSLSAAAVPLVMSVISIFIALGLSMIFAQVMTISVFLMNMVFMMGFALGIDYCLFIVSRYREERNHGWDKYDAIERSGATAGRAVLFSGLTVFLALIALMLVPHDVFVSLGLGAVLVVLVSIAASLTLVPAVLGIMGDRINSLRVPIIYKLQAKADPENTTGIWDRISRLVMKRAVISVLLCFGILMAAAVPLLGIDIGVSGVSRLPDNLESKKGFQALERDFSAGLTGPTQIVIEGNITSPDVQQGINNLQDAISLDSSFGAVKMETSPDEKIVLIESPVGGGDASSKAAIEAVKRLRRDYIPAAFEGIDATVLVTGQTAEAVDHINIGNNGLRVIIPFILFLSFILLTLVFRSLIIPLKAVIMNLLSVGAAYGLVVLVFQKGVGAGIFGFQKVDTIEWWVPAFLFAVLFGLSMDYHVLLLSRIRERFHMTRDNAGSVAYGIRSTGRLITGAALIMIAVFVGFASGDLVMFQQMGFGLAVAVLLDATIVRSVLVPASMKLLGSRNWYMPSWLNWLPAIRAEEDLEIRPKKAQETSAP